MEKILILLMICVWVKKKSALGSPLSFLHSHYFSVILLMIFYYRKKLCGVCLRRFPVHRGCGRRGHRRGHRRSWQRRTPHPALHGSPSGIPHQGKIVDTRGAGNMASAVEHLQNVCDEIGERAGGERREGRYQKNIQVSQRERRSYRSSLEKQ